MIREFTPAEAMKIAAQNADSYNGVPSVSRTLLAYIELLHERAAELENQHHDYMNREWIAVKRAQRAEAALRNENGGWLRVLENFVMPGALACLSREYAAGLPK